MEPKLKSVAIVVKRTRKSPSFCMITNRPAGNLYKMCPPCGLHIPNVVKVFGKNNINKINNLGNM